MKRREERTSRCSVKRSNMKTKRSKSIKSIRSNCSNTKMWMDLKTIDLKTRILESSVNTRIRNSSRTRHKLETRSKANRYRCWNDNISNSRDNIRRWRMIRWMIMRDMWKWWIWKGSIEKNNRIGMLVKGFSKMIVSIMGLIKWKIKG